MSNGSSIRSIDLIRAWVATSSISMRDLGLTVLICLGCVAMGLITLRVPAHVKMHRATVRRITGSFASKRPNIMVEVETEDGQSVVLHAYAYNPGLREGAKVCINEMRDTLRGGRMFGFALPYQCAPDYVANP